MKRGILNNIDFFEYTDFADIWIRDYAPLTVSEDGLHFPTKFEYNPAYIKEKYRAGARQDNEAGSALGKFYIDKGERSLYFKWDMGNLTHNGNGTALISNRLISDNESVSIEDELKPMLHVFLGFSNIIFIPVEPEDKTGHVDGMARFIDEKVLVVGEYPPQSENHNFMELLAKNLKADLGDEYTIIRLMNIVTDNSSQDGIYSAVGNHLNFLRLNDLILFPYYSQEISEQPLLNFIAEIERNGLNIRVVPVKIPETNKLAKLGGVLNCISWQVFSNMNENA
jgi:agmatine deiminase